MTRFPRSILAPGSIQKDTMLTQVCSNIAQYILTSNLGLRGECCFLSAYFFKAMFRASLPHPLADRDYAAYEVGEGCEVTSLVPGVDLISDRCETVPHAFTSHDCLCLCLHSGFAWTGALLWQLCVLSWKI